MLSEEEKDKALRELAQDLGDSGRFAASYSIKEFELLRENKLLKAQEAATRIEVHKYLTDGYLSGHRLIMLKYALAKGERP